MKLGTPKGKLRYWAVLLRLFVMGPFIVVAVVGAAAEAIVEWLCLFLPSPRKVPR